MISGVVGDICTSTRELSFHAGIHAGLLVEPMLHFPLCSTMMHEKHENGVTGYWL
jgi:hypothetical protein